MENNWTIEQTKKLFALANEATAQGKGLVHAFTRLSQESGRSVNSVRNYYYSQLKMFELVPQIAADLGITPPDGNRCEFELFTAEQINELIETVLTDKAKGISVYRRLVTHHRDRVTTVMKNLAQRGVPYFNPYLKQTMTGGESPDNYKKLNDYIAALDEAEVGEFLSLMKKLFA